MYALEATFQSDCYETWSECLSYEISHKLKIGHVGSKTRSQGQILEKTLYSL